MTREALNRLLLGTALAAGAAGLIYYLYHTEEVDTRLADLRDKASGAVDKAKTRLTQQMDNARYRMSRS